MNFVIVIQLENGIIRIEPPFAFLVGSDEVQERKLLVLGLVVIEAHEALLIGKLTSDLLVGERFRLSLECLG